MNKETAFITGASSGIGRELATIFARDGINLVIVARRLDRLNQLKQTLESNGNCQVEVLQADLSIPGTGAEILATLQRKHIAIDYLVNNAGFGGHGMFHQRNWPDDRDMIHVNVEALTELIRLILPQMVERNRGKILNIASAAAFLPGPLQAVYYATKAYVVSFSQAIAEELADTNITVSAYCPVATDTEFAAVGHLSDTPLFKHRNKQAADVARQAYATMQKGTLVKIASRFDAFSFRWIFPFFTRKIILKISRRLLKKS